MSTQKMKSRGGESSRPAVPESAGEEVVDRLAGLLPEDALQDALEGLAPEEITGPGGLLTQLAGRVIESALGAELSEHLGYPPGQAPPGGAGNVRNGSTPKTLRPSSARCRSGRHGTARGPLTRSWWASVRRVWPGSTTGCSICTPAACRSATSPHTCSASTASRSAVTRSAASPTRCSRTSRPGGRGRWRRSIRSSTSTRCT